MAELHVPLTVGPTGVFERASTEENVVGARLRLFLYAGAGEYLRLPSPGMRALWIQLYNIGITARLRDVLKEDERHTLEESIRSEVNVWLNELATVASVNLLGDERDENGIQFRTESFEFTFHFRFALPGRGLHSNAIGPWNIVETSNAIY